MRHLKILLFMQLLLGKREKMKILQNLFENAGNTYLITMRYVLQFIITRSSS